jgi:hypothetical protein
LIRVKQTVSWVQCVIFQWFDWLLGMTFGKTRRQTCGDQLQHSVAGGVGGAILWMEQQMDLP